MPRAGWVKPLSDRRLSDLVAIGLLTRVFPPAVVDGVVAEEGRTELRRRSLPARVMVYFAIAMALYSEGSYEDVFAQLTDGLSWSSAWSESWALPSKSGIFQARARLCMSCSREWLLRWPPTTRPGHGWLGAGWWPSTGAASTLPTPQRMRRTSVGLE